MKNNTKKFYKVFGIIIFSFVILNFIFLNVVSLINFNNNKMYDAETNGIIYNQFKYKQYKIGIGNVAENGCGPVAIYNILQMENKPQSLSSIIKVFDVSGLNFYGKLGTNPLTIKNYLTNCGFKTKIFFNPSIFEQMAKESKYSILIYVTPIYGHYQLMCHYDEKSDSFEFINTSYIGEFEDEIKNLDCIFACLLTVN